MIKNVMKTANDGKLNMMVEAEEMKTKEPNMQTTTFTTWSEGCQEGQYQRASDTIPTEGNVSHSGTEDPQALKDRVLCSIAMNYLQTTPPQTREDRKEFQEYLREMRVILTGVSVGSLVITVRCDSLRILEELWKDYLSGHLSEMVQNCFVTEKILKELNLAELKLKTTMDLEEYKARKRYFEIVELRDFLGSQSYFISFEDEAHLEKRTQKIEVEEPEKMKETPPGQDEGRLEKIEQRIKAGESKRVKDFSLSRTLQQEKNIAQMFVYFLEDDNRKEDMSIDDLKQIYKGEFRPLYNTLGMSFSRVLNTLTYHINACQQLQDRVIFGGGEAAALQLLTDDPVEHGDSDDDSGYRSFLGLGPFYCKTCKRYLGNGEAYNKHIKGVKHRQQSILVMLRNSLKKSEYVFDKKGIRVTSDPAGDEHGVIELKVESGTYEQIVLIIENLSEEIIALKDIILLWSVNFFDYREISSIGPDEGQLYPGCQQRFRIGCKRRREFGYSYVPGVLTFQTEDGVEFHILRFLSVLIMSDLYDVLKQTSEYRPPPRAPEIPRDVKTFGGIPLPRLQRNGLIMEKLDSYEIPLTVKAQVIKNNQIREGLCERLKKKLSFDNYKEKFCLLLHLEEFQMQKDIRNYDMKGVVFQQERGDRRFLIIEVPGLAENRPSVLRGDKIYAYEPGVLQRRYEGIVHKVEMLDVKLGFDMNEYIVY